MSFICAGFSEEYVHYLAKKMKKGGPYDGSTPSRVAKVERSLQLGVVYPEIEHELLKV